ncbi:hypothetical protein GNI_129180 [Gregarina niphandrodes]|uniref:Uncharacterized protein n=1 Tax=Gregarina niphandrodes TaxID=110365 RepID=A0A023B1N6_GRENI|nr:hypothetical protein GNI_129180 [Gregarina niphandrodes]EZG48333.1 hypothetical protein GNI_129180 [Gregarina niphandrodes]|eukprot:XP_011132103.1 hypothetical protein GNI_129180 [Gregarina niphandrodes]
MCKNHGRLAPELSCDPPYRLVDDRCEKRQIGPAEIGCLPGEKKEGYACIGAEHVAMVLKCPKDYTAHDTPEKEGTCERKFEYKGEWINDTPHCPNAPNHFPTTAPIDHNGSKQRFAGPWMEVFYERNRTRLAIPEVVCSVYDFRIGHYECPKDSVPFEEWVARGNWPIVTFQTGLGDPKYTCVHPQKYPWRPVCSTFRGRAFVRPLVPIRDYYWMERPPGIIWAGGSKFVELYQQTVQALRQSRDRPTTEMDEARWRPTRNSTVSKRPTEEKDAPHSLGQMAKGYLDEDDESANGPLGSMSPLLNPSIGERPGSTRRLFDNWDHDDEDDHWDRSSARRRRLASGELRRPGSSLPNSVLKQTQARLYGDGLPEVQYEGESVGLWSIDDEVDRDIIEDVAKRELDAKLSKFNHTVAQSMIRSLKAVYRNLIDGDLDTGIGGEDWGTTVNVDVREGGSREGDGADTIDVETQIMYVDPDTQQKLRTELTIALSLAKENGPEVLRVNLTNSLVGGYEAFNGPGGRGDRVYFRPRPREQAGQAKPPSARVRLDNYTMERPGPVDELPDPSDYVAAARYTNRLIVDMWKELHWTHLDMDDLGIDTWIRLMSPKPREVDVASRLWLSWVHEGLMMPICTEYEMRLPRQRCPESFRMGTDQSCKPKDYGSPIIECPPEFVFDPMSVIKLPGERFPGQDEAWDAGFRGLPRNRGLVGPGGPRQGLGPDGKERSSGADDLVIRKHNLPKCVGFLDAYTENFCEDPACYPDLENRLCVCDMKIAKAEQSPSSFDLKKAWGNTGEELYDSLQAYINKSPDTWYPLISTMYPMMIFRATFHEFYDNSTRDARFKLQLYKESPEYGIFRALFNPKDYIHWVRTKRDFQSEFLVNTVADRLLITINRAAVPAQLLANQGEAFEYNYGNAAYDRISERRRDLDPLQDGNPLGNIPGLQASQLRTLSSSRRSDSQLSDSQRSDGQRSDSQLSDSQLSDSQLSDSQLSDSQLSDSQLSDTDTKRQSPGIHLGKTYLSTEDFVILRAAAQRQVEKLGPDHDVSHTGVRGDGEIAALIRHLANRVPEDELLAAYNLIRQTARHGSIPEHADVAEAQKVAQQKNILSYSKEKKDRDPHGGESWKETTGGKQKSLETHILTLMGQMDGPEIGKRERRNRERHHSDTKHTDTDHTDTHHTDTHRTDTDHTDTHHSGTHVRGEVVSISEAEAKTRKATPIDMFWRPNLHRWRTSIQAARVIDTEGGTHLAGIVEDYWR